MKLSRYNQATRCWRHRREQQHEAFLHGIEGQDTMTAAERRRYVEGNW